MPGGRSNTRRTHSAIAPILVASACLALSSCASTPGLKAAPPPRASTAPSSADLVESPAVGASFTIEAHSLTDLSSFETFTYSTATTVGLTPAATVAADAAVAQMVDTAIEAATKANDVGCEFPYSPCGIFIQELLPEPCSQGLLCLRQTISAAWPGAATGDEQTNTLILNATTGATVTLRDFLGAPQLPEFLNGANDAAKRWQVDHEFYDSADPPLLAEDDLAAWVPRAEGVHLWIPKYVIGSGADGVVDLDVPLPGSAAALPAAPDPGQSAQDYVTVPNVVGLGNNDARRALMSAGLAVSISAINGDPSVAAQTNNGCIVISQSIAPDTQVPRNTNIQARMDCPSTGQY
jgi:hypothetical protein